MSKKLDAAARHARDAERVAYERVSETVRLAASKLGSLEALAERIGASRSAVYNWAGSIGGSTRKPRAVALPRAQVLRALADLTGVSVDWLLSLEVPRRWADRAAAGPLLDECLRLIESATPPPLRQPEFSWIREIVVGGPDDEPDDGIPWQMALYWWERWGNLFKQKQVGEALQKLSSQLTAAAYGGQHQDRQEEILSCAESARRLAYEANDLAPDPWGFLLHLRKRPIFANLKVDDDGFTTSLDEPLYIVTIDSFAGPSMCFIDRDGVGHAWGLDETFEPTYRRGKIFRLAFNGELDRLLGGGIDSDIESFMKNDSRAHAIGASPISDDSLDADVAGWLGTLKKPRNAWTIEDYERILGKSSTVTELARRNGVVDVAADENAPSSISD